MAKEPIVIYHNARCSKSRSACDIISALGLSADIIDYLATPPSKAELREILEKLDMQPGELVRHSEPAYKEHYAGRKMSDDDWLDALIAHPILIERPIVVRGDRAVIGRPPERVMEFLNSAD